jgi:putative ABC transport system permease protein
MDSLVSDLRDAVRSIRRAPAFATIVILTLALGIGANTAIFSVVDALLFKSLPYPDADRLTLLAEWPSTGGNYTVAPAAFGNWRDAARSWERIEARFPQRLALLSNGDPEELRGALVTTGYFDLLGVRAAVGRTFTADDASASGCAAVISHRLWMRRFNGSHSALGQPVRMTGRTCPLVGVLPAEPAFDRAPFEIFMPLVLTPAQAQDQGRFLTVLGRLRPDVSIDQARSELVNVAAAFNATRGTAGRGWTARVTPYRDSVVRADSRVLVWVLFGAVLLVLLIACVNVAGLSLSRLAARQHEAAIRAALGASRWRTFRALVLENVVLGLVGGVAGLVTAAWVLRLFLSAAPAGTFPAEAVPTLDWRTLIFTMTMALGTGVLCGLLPAWQAGRTVLAGPLRALGRGVTRSRATLRLHGGLMVVETALAMVLVTAAALLLGSFVRLLRVDPGFDPEGVMTFRLTTPVSQSPTDDTARIADRYARALDEIRRIPGVEHAGAVTSLPLGGWLFGTRFAIHGQATDPDRPPSAHLQHVTPGYVEALRIPVVAGRAFLPTDIARSAPVAMVNQTFLSRFLSGQPAVGRRLDLGDQQPNWLEIVGVLGDVKTGALRDAALATPEIYVPHAQRPMPAMFVAIRSRSASPAGLARGIREAVNRVDPDLPVSELVSMEERLGVSLQTTRFRTALISSFGIVAAMLAALGVYGARSRAVAARTREMGIRFALGASPGQVVRMVLMQGLRLAAVGMAIGLALSMWTARALEGWLFQTAKTDPLVMAVALIVLAAASLAASWLPARRAAAVDPNAVLRDG